MEVGNEFLQQHSGSFSLKFGQLGHFDGTVIFAGLHPEDKEGGEHLSRLSAGLMERCRTSNIHLVDDRFYPHVTLLKLSKDPQLRKKVLHLYILSTLKSSFVFNFFVFLGDKKSVTYFIREPL